jgi:predicted metal-dependent peptidase
MNKVAVKKIKENKNIDKQKVLEKLTGARIALLLKQPFFGNMATRMQLQEADWCPTAATDGRNFYYNPEFIDSLSPKETEFLIGHEVLHIVFDHFLRQDMREKQPWNVSTDYAVNQVLTDENIGEMPTGDNKGLLDSKYKDWNAEKIYEDVMKDKDKQKQQTIDMHIDFESGKATVRDQDGNKIKVDLEINKEDVKKIKDEIRHSVLQSAQVAGKGKTPKSIRGLIEELTEPVINWRELLRQQIQSVIKNDYSFSRINRKTQHSGIVLPGMIQDETIDIAIAVDTSGSIEEKKLNEFMSEIQGIMEEYQDYKMKVWCFDTEVHNPQEFTADDGNEITDYKPAGFGGTDFMANWEWMKKEGYEPKKLVVFTDGETWNEWGDENYCDTCWIIHSYYKENKPKPPFGAYSYYDENI